MNILCLSKSNLIIIGLARKLITEKAGKLEVKASMLGMFALIGTCYFTGKNLRGIF